MLSCGWLEKLTPSGKEKPIGEMVVQKLAKYVCLQINKIGFGVSGVPSLPVCPTAVQVVSEHKDGLQ